MTKLGDELQAVQRCCNGKCHCRCHKSYKIEGRFWSIEVPQFSRMLMRCDRPYCRIRRHRQSCRLALSRLGIPIALVMTLEIGQTPNGYSIAPSLEYPSIREYTSPGFEVMWKLEKFLISLEEAKASLQDLFRRREVDVLDVDPAGRGWLEVILAPRFDDNYILK